ncbi:MAG TPA: putative cytokinetic ring protein SteA [Actinomycetota bacterium]|nr:putative cytokinetic ring protein SteA [Actinomycetota bacterium]
MRFLLPRRHRPEPGPGDVLGAVRRDRRTKNLVKRLRPGDVAVIDHADIDRVAAETLVECRPAAVVNAAASISGQYPHAGPMVLVEAGIPLLDDVGQDVFDFLREGDEVRIDPDGVVYRDGSRVASGEWLRPEDVRKRVDAAKDNLATALEDFTLNTLSYVRRDRDLLLEGLDIPGLATSMRDRHVLVVVRGHDYKKDLSTLRGYIREFRPVLIGVDGGADALLEEGYKPDVILGDMDSVTSEALACGAEVVVHAYPDGRAPGKERVEALGIVPFVFPGAGTSEDMAMLLAYEADCDLIVAVGSHASMVEFLDKGRPGMASTFLVRLKVGSKLVDAKGVNRLYRQGVRRGDLLLLVAAALVAMLVIALVSEPVRLVWEQALELLKAFFHRLTSLF